MMKRCLFVLTPLFASSLIAQSVAVPNVDPATHTGGLNTLVRNSGNPRTYQVVINAAELAALPIGANINGYSVRFAVTASNTIGVPWPPAVTTWADYEIFVGASVPAAAATTTFASNWIGVPTMVRDGAMVMEAGVYVNNNPVAPTPNPWGEFYFDFQVPHVYTGGDLGILFTHPGSDQAASAQFPEVVSSNAAAQGVAFSATTFQALTGTAATFYVSRIHYGYGSGCAGTGGFVPNLVQNENTIGGGTLLFTAANSPANSAAFFVFGFGAVVTPLPGGCNLLVTPPVATSFALLSPLGRAATRIGIPPNITGTFNAQVLILDAGGPAGFTVSNGVNPSAL